MIAHEETPMTVTVIPQPKTTFTEPSAPALSELAPQIDEVGALAAKIEKLEAQIYEKTKALQEKLAALQEQYEPKLMALTAQVNELLNGADPDQTFVELGAHYQAKISKQGTLRVVEDMKLLKALFDAIHSELFWQKARIRIKDCDEYLTPEEREAVLETKRTPRKVDIVKRVV
jgi:vancomycin resistance protein YoaR